MSLDSDFNSYDVGTFVVTSNANIEYIEVPDQFNTVILMNDPGNTGTLWWGRGAVIDGAVGTAFDRADPAHRLLPIPPGGSFTIALDSELDTYADDHVLAVHYDGPITDVLRAYMTSETE